MGSKRRSSKEQDHSAEESKIKRRKNEDDVAGPSLNNDTITLDEMIPTIKKMMYAFGDNKNPSKESVVVVRDILVDQMEVLIDEAMDAAALRTETSEPTQISHEDVLFLMRKNKAKLKRLMAYLKILDMGKGIERQLAGFATLPAKKEGDDLATLVQNSSDTDGLATISEKYTKRVDLCKSFFGKIEDCEELSSLPDDTTVRDYRWKNRIKNRNERVEIMDKEEYMGDFVKALQSSFCPKQDRKAFRKFLEIFTSCTVTDLAVTILAYLARETVAEIVELALLVKSEMKEGRLLLGNGFIIPYPSEFEEEAWALPPGKRKDISQSTTDGSEANKTMDEESSHITVQEIDDAFCRFRKPHGPLMLFSHDRSPKKTRLLCLADLFSFY